MLARIHRFLAGTDGPTQPALPVGEFFHPAVLAAAVLLIVNDHALKGGGAPPWLTGKLSDFAGLLLFPVLFTASLDTILLGLFRLGWRVDFSLRLGKLAAIATMTGVIFAATKLFAPAALTVETALAALGFPSRIAVDPTDLVAVPMVFVAFLIGRAEVRRVPLGRVRVVMAAIAAASDHGPKTARLLLADIYRLRPNDTDSLDRLVDGLVTGAKSATYDDANMALARLRGSLAR